MVIKESIQIKDFSAVDYFKLQHDEVTPRQVEYRAHRVRPSGNFNFRNGFWEANTYTGFAIVSMIENNPFNFFLHFQLEEIQNELKESLADDAAYYMLPPDSFHQTMANMVSNDVFKRLILDKGLEGTYPEMVNDAFNEINQTVKNKPIKMKLIGLSIFGTAIGVLGVFDTEEDYNRIIDFRNSFYSHQQLKEIGVHLTRPFIGHITLAYVERNLREEERHHLASVVKSINARLINDNTYFYISKTELRRYHHLAEFIKEDNFPEFYFNT